MNGDDDEKTFILSDDGLDSWKQSKNISFFRRKITFFFNFILRIQGGKK